jgi:hypothetical protein
LWDGTRVTVPDQASAFLISNLGVREEDGFLEVFKVCLIQGKLPLHDSGSAPMRATEYVLPLGSHNA